MSGVPAWYFDSMPKEGEKFKTRDALELKVDAEGRLKPFGGETSVFLLPDVVKDKLIEVQDELYAAAGKMLSKQRLSRESLHMTLHDLWNEGDKKDYPAPPYSPDEVCRVLEGIRRDYPHNIMMRAIVPMSMVNTSVVMGLVPASPLDRWTLGDMDSRMNAMMPRSYGLTPHITLAYYRPGEYDYEVWKKLKAAFKVQGFSFPLSTRRLVYQRFYDMERYETIY